MKTKKISREAPGWKEKISKPIRTKEDLIEVAEGRYPLGLLPEDLFPMSELDMVQRILPFIPSRQYSDTNKNEDLEVWGDPFVESPSITAHLEKPRNGQFHALTMPTYTRIENYLRRLGFNIAPLVDRATGLPYSYMVARKISVPEDCVTDAGNACNVLHFDDFVRDASTKPDFSEERLPKGIELNNYHQFSICIPLCNGFFRPDHLEVYDYRYFPKDKTELDNWRVMEDRVEEKDTYRHVPQNGQAYLFNTQNPHDVLGGDSRSRRINLSIFFLYVPETNTLYPYN